MSRRPRARAGSTSGPSYRQHVAPVRPGDWSAGALRARCATLRSALAARGVSEDALARVWPGGEENAERGTGAWVSAYAALRALHATQRTATAAAPAQDAAALRRVVAQSLADRPEPVTLTDGTRRLVCPKSLVALWHLDALDAAIARLAACDTVEREAGLDVQAPALRSLAVRVWAWIVTHEGPGMPFAPSAENPEPPAWTAALAPEDVLALVAAHRRVHALRLAMLGQAFPRRADAGSAESRLSFEGFVGTFAADKGHDPLEVMEQWSLGRVVATAVSEAESHAVAQARAEAEQAARAAREPRQPAGMR